MKDITKQRNNNMTCPKCNYMYCFACGASASEEEGHFEAFRGCGAKLADRLLKPQNYMD